MNDIKDFHTFRLIEPIHKGWSTDEKYYIETANNEKRLLRLAKQSEYKHKLAEFNIMKQVAALGIPMSQPLDFGICQQGERVYSLFTWCEGQEAKDLLPHLTQAKQYELGLAAGNLLKRIHSISAPPTQESWASSFHQKINAKIEKYSQCGISFDGDQQIITYIENNRHLLENRPQTLHHGDYHIGNMIISPSHTLSIIDFNRFDFGDPWEEFNRIVWSAEISPPFATGQLNGYFAGKPPLDFFKLLALYICNNTLSSFPWAIPFGEKEILTMRKQAQSVLSWYDYMNTPVPSWYLE